MCTSLWLLLQGQQGSPLKGQQHTSSKQQGSGAGTPFQATYQCEIKSEVLQEFRDIENIK